MCGPATKPTTAAGDEANRTAHKGARGRAERAVEHPLPGAGRSRRRQRRGNDCDRNNLSHDFPPMMLAYHPSLGERSPLVRPIKQPPARLKLRKRLLEPVEIFRRDALRRRRSYGS